MKRPLIIVTGDDALARSLESLCPLAGWSVAGRAPSATEAARLFDALSPAMALIDADLGDDALALARSFDAKRSVEIVLLAARGDEETVRRLISVQPRGILVKPVDEERLRATLQTAWTRHLAERRLQRVYDNTPNGILLFRYVPEEGTYRLERRNRAAEALDAPLTEPHPTFETYFSPFDFRELRLLLERSRREGCLFPCTLVHRREALLAWRQYYLYPVDDGEMIALFQDVTEEKRLREEQERRLHELARETLRERSLARIAALLFDRSIPIEGRLDESLRQLAEAVRPGGGLGLRLSWPDGTKESMEGEGLSTTPFRLAVDASGLRATLEILFGRHDVDGLLFGSVDDGETTFLRRGLDLIHKALLCDRVWRKQTLKATLYERTLQSLPLPLALGDDEGKLFFVNEAFEERTGLFGEEIFDLPLEEVGRRVDGRIHPLDVSGRPSGALLVIEEEEGRR